MRTIICVICLSFSSAFAIDKVEPEDLRKIVNNVLKDTKHDSNITDALILAFAHVESGFVINATGDKGEAYGLFQFHKARWLECGGTEDNWKKSDTKTQVKIMIKALNSYCKKNIDGVEAVRWMATSHNIGHGVDEDTLYVKKIREAKKKYYIKEK